jgi:hypothetical protein
MLNRQDVIVVELCQQFEVSRRGSLQRHASPLSHRRTAPVEAAYART